MKHKMKIGISLVYAVIFLVFAGTGVLHGQASAAEQAFAPAVPAIEKTRD